jgi:hypothetical protein
MMLSWVHHHAARLGQQTTSEALRHKLEATRLIKNALQDPGKSTSDEMIQTAIYIAGDEVCPLDLTSPELSRYNLNGLGNPLLTRTPHSLVGGAMRQLESTCLESVV